MTGNAAPMTSTAETSLLAAAAAFAAIGTGGQAQGQLVPWRRPWSLFTQTHHLAMALRSAVSRPLGSRWW
jgi:hypothetical protein